MWKQISKQIKSYNESVQAEKYLSQPLTKMNLKEGGQEVWGQGKHRGWTEQFAITKWRTQKRGDL